MSKKYSSQLTNLSIIIELKYLFNEKPDIVQKLQIIELYISAATDEEFIHSYKQLQRSNPNSYKKIKLSRALCIVNSFVTNSQSSGYIQPIGKQLFLDIFLKRYPSPRFLHLGERNWTERLLAEYIQIKYYCTITPDSIRKALTQLKKYLTFHNTSTELLYHKFLVRKLNTIKSSDYIYFYQLYYSSYPIRKSKSSKPNYSRKTTFVGCIYGKNLLNKSIAYSRTPYFQLSYNDQNYIINLNYYLNIPINPGLILLPDTYDSRKIVKDWYFWYFSQDKMPPKHQLFFIPENAYSSLHLSAFDTYYSLMKYPMQNFGISYFRKLSSCNVLSSFFNGYIKENHSSKHECKLLPITKTSYKEIT